MYLFGLLNTRELALLIWGTIFMVVILCNNKIALSVKKIIQEFLKKEILTSLTVIILFSTCCVSILHGVGFWNMTFFKDTILWFFAVPFMTMVRLRKISEDKSYFENSLKDLFAFSALADFLISSYTFSLPTEIIITFFIVILTLMLTSLQKKVIYKSTTKFVKNFLFILGLTMAINSIIQIVKHLNEFTSWDTLNTFLLPQFLTLLYLPFIFLILLYTEYDFSFKILPREIKDKELFKKAKKMAIINFGLNWRALKRWRTNIFRHGEITTLNELKETFNRYHLLRIQEKNPPEIIQKEGWSPYKAKDFLIEEVMPTGIYDRMYDETYYATSNFKNLNPEAIVSNMIVYTIEGNMKAVNKLTLSLTVHTTFNNDEEVGIVDYIKILLNKATGKDLPFEAELAVISKQNLSWEDDLYNYILEKKDFLTAKNGYFQNFSIVLKTHEN